jgi:thioredoxin-related protein
MTSLLLLALSPTLGALAPAPEWSSDYRAALLKAEKAQKPLAVVIASGPQGWQAVSKDRSLPPQVRKLLSEKYVCVYVDTSEPAGRKLATAFEVKSLPTLVISDKTGEYQAHRSSGTLDGDQLTHLLTKYVAYEVPQPVAPPVQPAGYYPPPAYGGFGSFGSFGGRACRG